MRFLLNIIWIIFGGFWMAVGYALIGLLLCLTVIGIPFGVQLLKLAGYVLWPFGRTVVKTTDVPGLSFLGNLLWLPIGFFVAVGHLISAVACAFTIIGIPFAFAHVKLAILAIAPFGRTVMSNSELESAFAAHRFERSDPVTISAGTSR